MNKSIFSQEKLVLFIFATYFFRTFFLGSVFLSNFASMKQTKHPATTDIAVLVLFFNRPDMLKKLFEQIKKARPSRLLLYQDGARNEADKERMQQCRDVVDDSQIDWQCTVHRNYREENRGCDPSNYLSLKWAFSLYDKCIKFEDDDCPSLSFFPFCKEMLDRYEHDERIRMISGMNFDEETKDMPYDYFFTRTFSINAWATWRRVIDKIDDERYSFLDDAFNMEQLKAIVKEHKFQKDLVDYCEYHRSTGKAYYESLLYVSMLFNSGLSIIPRVNMNSNAGATTEGTHYAGTNELIPSGLRRIFNLRCHELQFPLRHPKYVMENVEYKKRVFRIMAWGHPWVKVWRSFEELYLNLRHGNIKNIFSAIHHRIRIWLNFPRYK